MIKYKESNDKKINRRRQIDKIYHSNLYGMTLSYHSNVTFDLTRKHSVKSVQNVLLFILDSSVYL